MNSLKDLPFAYRNFLNIFLSAAPVAGSIFAAFLSEVTGRKPVYIYLFALSTLSPILIASSSHTTVTVLASLLEGILVGGTFVMNAVAICEYSCPKHRFSWMLAYIATKQIVLYTSMFLLFNKVVASDVLIVVQIVLGLMCLGSTWVWPESPYWLASKGKLEESRKAFLFLRGEESRKETGSVLEARRRPGPPRLFWTSLGLAIATMSVAVFSTLQENMSHIFYREQDTNTPKFIIILVSGVVVYCVIAVMSYFIKRKLLFIVVSGGTFILSNVVALWMYLESGNDFEGTFFYFWFLLSVVINRCGILAFSVIMFIEIVPYKYNTVISCICFIFFNMSHLLLIKLQIYLLHYPFFHLTAFFALFATFALFGALIYFFFGPETKDKTLIEIQKTYMPDEIDSKRDQNMSMIQSIT